MKSRMRLSQQPTNIENVITKKIELDDINYKKSKNLFFLPCVCYHFINYNEIKSGFSSKGSRKLHPQKKYRNREAPLMKGACPNNGLNCHLVSLWSPFLLHHDLIQQPGHLTKFIKTFSIKSHEQN